MYHHGRSYTCHFNVWSHKNTFSVFNMIDFCYKNFKNVTSVINDTTDLFIALKTVIFAGNRKNLPSNLADLQDEGIMHSFS